MALPLPLAGLAKAPLAGPAPSLGPKPSLGPSLGGPGAGSDPHPTFACPNCGAKLSVEKESEAADEHGGGGLMAPAPSGPGPLLGR